MVCMVIYRSNIYRFKNETCSECPKIHFGFGIYESDATLKNGIFFATVHDQPNRTDRQTDGHPSEQMRCSALETARLKRWPLKAAVKISMFLVPLPLRLPCRWIRYWWWKWQKYQVVKVSPGGSLLGANWSEGSKPNVILGFTVPTTIGGKTSIITYSAYMCSPRSQPGPLTPNGVSRGRGLCRSTSISWVPISCGGKFWSSHHLSWDKAPSPHSQVAPLTPKGLSAGRAQWISRCTFWCPHYMSEQVSVRPPVLIG